MANIVAPSVGLISKYLILAPPKASKTKQKSIRVNFICRALETAINKSVPCWAAAKNLQQVRPCL